MPSWQDTIIISSLVVKDLYGVAITAHPQVNTASALSVRPLHNTGHYAQGIIVYPSADCHFALDAIATTIGLNSARLIAGNEYVFPLNPRVNTVTFLDAQSASNAVYVRYVLSR